MNGLRKRCFKSLCNMCSAREILPALYTLNIRDCLQQGETPNYAGGLGEVWRGTYKGKAVAIKKLRGVSVEWLEKSKKVYSSAWSVSAIVAKVRNSCSAMKLSFGRGFQTPTYSL